MAVLTDNFNRTNQPLEDGPWTRRDGDPSALAIESNELVNNSPGTYVYDDGELDDDGTEQYVEIEVVDGVLVSAAQPMLRMGSGSTDLDGYSLELQSPDQLILQQIHNGSVSPLDIATVGSTAGPLTLKITATDTIIRGYIDNVLKVSAASVTHSSSRTKVGLRNAGEEWTHNNWAAGNTVELVSFAMGLRGQRHVIFESLVMSARGQRRALRTYQHSPRGARHMFNAFTMQPRGGTRFRFISAVSSLRGARHVYGSFQAQPRGQRRMLQAFTMQPRGFRKAVFNAFTAAARGSRAVFGAFYTATARGLRRIPNDALDRYELYVGEDSDPDTSGTPDATSASLPITRALDPAPTGQTIDYHLVTLLNSRWGLRWPVGPVTVIRIDDAGEEVVPAPSAPTFSAEALPDGRIRVTGEYRWREDTANQRADEWVVWAKVGSDPVPGTDSPIATLDQFHNFQVEDLEHDSDPFSGGADVRVLVRVQRSEDSEQSDNTTAVQVTATDKGSPVGRSGGFLGREQKQE